jgi:hypothetical protein
MESETILNDEILLQLGFEKQEFGDMFEYAEGDCEFVLDKLKDGSYWVRVGNDLHVLRTVKYQSQIVNLFNALYDKDIAKNNSLKERTKHIREQAVFVFELTKGFVGEPTDEAMKTALEMAGYVLELTN